MGTYYKKHDFTQREDEIIREMYEGGCQMWKIEDALGFTKTVIYRRIKELNLKRSPGYNPHSFYGIFTHKNRR